MTVAAVVVAGGRGTRFGGLKQFADLNGRSVAARSVAAARSIASHVVLVVPEDYVGAGEGADVVVHGGPTRASSVRAGLAHCVDASIIVIHDAARPLASPALFAAVVRAVNEGADAAVPGLAVTDTVKRVEQEGDDVVAVATVERAELVTVQTPQAFRRDALVRAHAAAGEATDDAALVESVGGRIVVIAGEPENVKITAPADLERMRGPWASLRIGQGVDVHRFSDDATRSLWLGLVEVPDSPGLAGHSDADVAAHAVADALLGAAGLGDIGRHFPDTDASTAGISSKVLLSDIVELTRNAGYRAVSVDVTIVAQRPKLAPFMATMAERLSVVVGAPVSVKATTTEGLGAIGRSEGIAATAVAILGAL